MAQVTINSTTLSAAVTTVKDTKLTVASATGFAADNIVYVDREAMRVRGDYVSGTTIPVTRGVLGTQVSKHASGAVVWCGEPKEFYHYDPQGYEETANIYALPWIVVQKGNVWSLAGTQWVLLRHLGLGLQGNAKEFDYTAAGAITIAPGVHKVNGTTLAMTLANPGPEHNGVLMTVTDANGSAHTLTVTGGFGDGGAGEDVATFSGVKGDSITLVAQDSLWHIVGAHQVTVA